MGLGEVLWEAESRGPVCITGFGRRPLMGTERSNDVTAIYRGGGEKGALGENVAGSQVGRAGYTEGRHLSHLGVYRCSETRGSAVSRGG